MYLVYGVHLPHLAASWYLVLGVLGGPWVFGSWHTWKWIPWVSGCGPSVFVYVLTRRQEGMCQFVLVVQWNRIS